MSSLKKKHNHYKPLYKQFIKLRENIQERKKILNFKKQKWKLFIESYKTQLEEYNRFTPLNQAMYTVSEFSNKKTSYKKSYFNTYISIKLFKLFYGGLKHKYFKKNLNLVKQNKNSYKKFLKLKMLFFEIFEKRLDTILYRSKFSFSIRNARQLISHGKIFINHKKVTSKSYLLKNGDFITVDSNYHYLIKKNIKTNLMTDRIWPLPPDNLVINYKTLQIVFRNLKNQSHNFFNNLNLEKILNYY